jgi:hypothetical protein
MWKLGSNTNMSIKALPLKVGLLEKTGGGRKERNDRE